MRTTLIVILAIVLFASTNALTSQDIIAAVNFARKNPLIIRDRIQAQFPNMTGTARDKTCYADAIKFLSVQASLPPLSENIGADLAAWKHSRYIAETLKSVSHTGEGGSSVKDRILAVGEWVSCWRYSENIAATYKQDAAYPPADEFVQMWIIDAGVYNRGHRNNIYDIKLEQQGCGVFQSSMNPNGVLYTITVVTCDGVKGYAIKEAAKAQLEEAGLSMAKNGAGFTGV